MNIVINGDDFGRSHNRNIAIDKALREGLIDRASLMVNAPFADEAISMIKENNYQDKICLHINLSCGEPLSEKIKSSIYCSDGYFIELSMVQRNLNFPLAAIRDEIKAQVEKYRTVVDQDRFWGRHFDSHLNYHLDLPVIIVVVSQMKRFGFTSVRSVGSHFLKYSRAKFYFKVVNAIYNQFFERVRWSSNLDLFFTERPKMADSDTVELYCHPEIIEGVNMDNTRSIFGNKIEPLAANIERLNALLKEE